MNEAQQEELFIEWELYEERIRKAMIDEYPHLRKSQKFEDSFLDFLKDKLQIEGYWEKVSLS